MSRSAGAAPTRTLSLLDATAMLIAIVVGIGIFKAPSLVAANVGSELAFLGLWLLGGVLTLVGALCYAELACARPDAGGEYHFLSRAYGQPVGLFFAWARGSVIQTGAIAAVTFVYGEYAARLIPLGAHGASIHAALALLALTGINLIGTLQSKRAQLAFTALEMIAIVLVIGAGFIANAAPSPQIVERASSGSAGLAMVFVLLTYGGWNEAAYLSAELRNPRRNMALALVLSVAVVTLVYGLVNVAYLNILGLQGLRDSPAVAADLMRLAAGEHGAIILSLIICITTLSTLNATIFTGARVYYALGRDLSALRRLGEWESRGHKPANAILLQSAIALALILFGSLTRDGFEAMVAYTAPVFWFFLLLTGISVFVFRRRNPSRDLPFRVPLYPLTPIVFCLTCAWMLYSSLVYAGWGAVVGVAVLLAGTPLLLIRSRPEQTATTPAE
jgi:APA family basic amino acid/polyamine antiporter